MRLYLYRPVRKLAHVVCVLLVCGVFVLDIGGQSRSAQDAAPAAMQAPGTGGAQAAPVGQIPVLKARLEQMYATADFNGDGVADYAALPGAPITTGKTFHRLDEDIEKREIEAAGFKLVDEGMFLRNPNDPHDMPIFKPKIPIDIYVLKFQKP